MLPPGILKNNPGPPRPRTRLFFLPTYPSDLACIGFDRSGTTRIGKYILNHSFMIPGLIGVISGCCVGFVMAHIVL